MIERKGNINYHEPQNLHRIRKYILKIKAVLSLDAATNVIVGKSLMCHYTFMYFTPSRLTVYGDMVKQCPIVLPTCREDRSVWQIYVVGTETLSSIETSRIVSSCPNPVLTGNPQFEASYEPSPC